MKNRLRNLLAPLVLCGTLYGCGAIQSVMGWGQPTPTEKVIEAVTSANETLTVLSAVGGLCLLSGMVLLCLSRGTMGWRPIIGGISLIVLNYVISIYASWIFLPIIGATGAISLVWGWSCIRDIIRIQKEK